MLEGDDCGEVTWLSVAGWEFEFGLRFVEGDVGDIFLGSGEVDEWLRGWVIAPGAYRVEVGEERGREAGGEGFAAEFLREAGGEVLKHDEGDEDGVAWSPGGGIVVEETELEWEMGTLEVHGGVYAAGVEVEVVELGRIENCNGSLCGSTELKGSLGAVVSEELGAEEFGEGSEGVAAEGLHLPEAVLRGDEALGDDEVVERCGFDGGDALGVALDCDGSGEAGNGEAAVELREGVAHCVAGPDARAEECADE